MFPVSLARLMLAGWLAGWRLRMDPGSVLRLVDVTLWTGRQ